MESPPSAGATLHPEFCPSRELEAHDLLARSQLSIQCDSRRAWESQRSAEMALLRGRGLSRRDARPKLSSENVAALCIEADTALPLGDTRGAKLWRPCAIEDRTSQRRGGGQTSTRSCPPD